MPAEAPPGRARPDVAGREAEAVKLENWPIDRIKPYERNPRANDAAVEAVAESIKRFGFRQPIVVDAEGVIVCGHTRWKAARKLGLDKVPVHVASDLTPEQIRAYRIADNKTAELAEWNLDLLPIELAELQDAGIDWSLLGFDSDELAKLLALDTPRRAALARRVATRFALRNGGVSRAGRRGGRQARPDRPRRGARAAG